jgi:four helix bundle protein
VPEEVLTSNPQRSDAPASDGAPAVLLDAERLDVYRAAVEFQAVAVRIMREANGTVRDQLDRASASVVLNIAEAAGRRADKEKAHFYAIARGSATECAAILDVARSRGFGSEDTFHEGRLLLVRIVQMLTRLDQGLRS